MAEQLCWSCKNAYGFCSWSDKTFTPVDGWTAVPTTIKANEKEIDTYHITACPMYESDNGKYKQRDQLHSKMGRLTNDEKQVICDMRRRGMKITYIAAAVQRSKDSVCRVLQAAGIETGPQKISSEKRAEIVGLRRSGTVLALISELAGVSVTSIQKILREEGVK